MTIFMGIVGQVLSLNDGRHQNSLGLLDCNRQSHTSIYLLLEQVSSSVQMHDCGHPTMTWSDDLLERELQVEFDFVEDLEYFQLATMPAVVESLICFLLRNDECEFVIGDLNERYSELYESFGKRKANLYVYREVCRSVFPFIRRSLVTAVRILVDQWIRKLTA
jgi:hypothetical protein